MKLLKLLLSLSLCLFPLLASTEEIKHSRSEMLTFLKTLEGKIGPAFLNDCSKTIREVTINNCGKMQSKVLTDYMTSVVQLNRLRDQVNAYSKRPAIRADKDKRKTLQKIQSVLICMHNKYSGMNIKCDSNCNPRIIAYTYTARDKDIQICDKYFNLSKTTRSATLLHELSHECGAKDWEYLYNRDKAIRKPTSLVGTKMQILGTKTGLSMILGEAYNASANAADNFRYWSLKGFCLPGHDC